MNVANSLCFHPFFAAREMKHHICEHKTVRFSSPRIILYVPL